MPSAPRSVHALWVISFCLLLTDKTAAEKPLSGVVSSHAFSFRADSVTLPAASSKDKALDLGAVSVQATLHSTADQLTAQDLRASVGESDLSGEVQLTSHSGRPALTATLASEYLDVRPYIDESETDDNDGKIFSSVPLPFDYLRSVDGHIDYTAKKIQTNQVSLEDVSISLELEAGILQINPLGLKSAGGTMQANITIDASDPGPARQKLSVDIKLFHPGRLADLKNQLTGTVTDARFDLQGNGNSVSDIMAGLNGNVLIKTGPGSMKNVPVELLETDLIFSTLNLLNPVKSRDNSREIECAVVNFQIEKGIATTNKGIALTTSNLHVVGSGLVNLETEAINIGIKPSKRKGVNINIGNLADLVKIGGTLADPKPVTDSVAAFKKTLSAGAAFATFGASLLAQGLLEKVTADDEPCKTALNMQLPSQPPQEESVEGNVLDKIKEGGNAIKNTIEELFD